MAAFCTMPGCYEVTITTARSDAHCRTHYRSEVLANATDLMRCEVTCGYGTRGEESGVSDAVTNQIVTKGGEVILDPTETNIAALVAGGTVKVLGPLVRDDSPSA
jgi:hypothetical protein